MNIFATSICPVESAKALDDKRLTKMVVETAQLLSTAVREEGFTAVADNAGLYRSTHASSKLVRWAAAGRSNFEWLVQHGLALADEYTARYGKVHASRAKIEAAAGFSGIFKPKSLTEFHNQAAHKGLGLNFTHLPVNEAYQAYLNARWSSGEKPPRWTKTSPPTWANFQRLPE